MDFSSLPVSNAEIVQQVTLQIWKHLWGQKSANIIGLETIQRQIFTLNHELCKWLPSIGFHPVVSTVLLGHIINDKDMLTSIFLEAIFEGLISGEFHTIFLPVQVRGLLFVNSHSFNTSVSISSNCNLLFKLIYYVLCTIKYIICYTHIF